MASAARQVKTILLPGGESDKGFDAGKNGDDAGRVWKIRWSENARQKRKRQAETKKPGRNEKARQKRKSQAETKKPGRNEKARQKQKSHPGGWLFV
jgi:hypothetical protein